MIVVHYIILHLLFCHKLISFLDVASYRVLVLFKQLIILFRKLFDWSLDLENLIDLKFYFENQFDRRNVWCNERFEFLLVLLLVDFLG